MQQIYNTYNTVFFQNQKSLNTKYLRLLDHKQNIKHNIYLQHIANIIVDIKARGQRVFVSDIQESLFVLRYKRQENQLIIFVDDTNQRWVTTSCLLDYDTTALADKFGNISVVSV